MYVVTSSVGTMYLFRQGGRGLQARPSVDSDRITCPIKNAVKGAYG